MPDLQILLLQPGDSISFSIAWLDENHACHSIPVIFELQQQNAPRLLGVKVDGKPVLLRSADTVFHSGAVEVTE